MEYRCSFSGACKLRDNLKPPFAFQQWNRDKSWNKKLKKALIWLSSTPESHWWYLFHKKVKSWDSTTWFRIWQFQTSALKLYLQRHLLAEQIVIKDDDQDFLKEGVKPNLMAPIPPLNSPTFFFFCLYIYSLWLYTSNIYWIGRSQMSSKSTSYSITDDVEIGRPLVCQNHSTWQDGLFTLCREPLKRQECRDADADWLAAPRPQERGCWVHDVRVLGWAKARDYVIERYHVTNYSRPYLRPNSKLFFFSSFF